MTTTNETNDKQIQLTTLEKEYETTLTQYQQALNNYISSLNSNQKSYSKLEGRAFWGQKALTQNAVNTIDDCVNMCKSDDKCTGATYNEKQHYCWTRQGNSPLTASDENDYAILTSDKVLLIRVKYLNEQLMTISRQIISNLQQLRPTLTKQRQENKQKQEQIEIHYVSLKKQKDDIDKELITYNTIDNDYSDQLLNVEQKKYNLRFWSFIAFLIVYFIASTIFGFVLPPTIILAFLIISFLLFLPSNKTKQNMVIIIVAIIVVGIINKLIL